MIINYKREAIFNHGLPYGYLWLFTFREIDKLQEELVDSESILESKRKVPINVVIVFSY